ncbi:hypothetical protein [Peribacillus simplex]
MEKISTIKQLGLSILIASNGLEKWKKSILIIDIYIGERSSKVQRPT